MGKLFRWKPRVRDVVCSVCFVGSSLEIAQAFPDAQGRLLPVGAGKLLIDTLPTRLIASGSTLPQLGLASTARFRGSGAEKRQRRRCNFPTQRLPLGFYLVFIIIPRAILDLIWISFSMQNLGFFFLPSVF